MSWSKAELNTWLDTLEAGGVVAAPAEGVYGYCADPLKQEALGRILELKQRNPKKGLICLVPDMAALGWICGNLTNHDMEAVGKYWPCGKDDPVTLILPAQEHAPHILTGGRGTLAVRLPATGYMQDYLQAWKERSGHGVLVSTSYNVSGEDPALDGERVEGVALRLPEKMGGRVSRIYYPADGVWLR
jgi:L-threonylcarbamoyladenylate synthase